MNTRNISIAIALFVLLVAGMFTFAYFKKSELDTPQNAPSEPVQNTDDDASASTERLNAKHFFIDGTHTIAGEIDLPTPCVLLDWDVLVAESFPEQVTIDFRMIDNAEVCAQVITPQKFLVSFDASSEAGISARIDGRPIQLNLIPAGEDETPDDFDIYIKG